MAKTPTPVEDDPFRPRHTADLVGHGAAEAALLDATIAGRLPPGWLITGPAGIGKATLAYRFARFMLAGGAAAGGGLFADAPRSLHIAAEDPVFHQVAAGAHVDLVTVEREASERTGRLSAYIRIEQIRALIQFFRLTAGQSGWRIAIVDGADTMNEAAANALLKVLEEPPAGALLLLTAPAPTQVIATIRSRCRQLALQPLDDEAMTNLLASRHPELAADDRQAIMRLAAGSPGRAHELVAAGGLDVYRDMLALLEPAPRLDMARLHALGDKLARREKQAEFEVCMDLLGLWISRVIRRSSGGSEFEMVAGEAALSARLLPSASLDRWLDLWDKVTRLARRADTASLDRKQVILAAFLAVADTVRG